MQKETISVMNEAVNTTPLMAQYLEIKEKYSDYLLFFRLGDFYELFFEDAEKASLILDIALTKRGRHGDQEIPMCGVPVHAHEIYLQKLIKQGLKVAICEQLEDPIEAKKRGYKSIVKRDVVRVVTPGTLIEEDLLSSRDNNFLAAFSENKGRAGIAWVDISTGLLQTINIPFEQAENMLRKLDPKELLISEKVIQNPELFEFFKIWKPILSPQHQRRFELHFAEKRLLSFYQIEAIESLGTFTHLEIASLGGLIDYIDLTQKGRMPRLSIPQQLRQGDIVEIDAATRLNLELIEGLNGNKKTTLLHILDHTLTSQGARAFRNFLVNPLTSVIRINERLDVVSFFAQKSELREQIRHILKTISDFERSLARILVKRFRPRDFQILKIALKEVSKISDLLRLNQSDLPILLQNLFISLGCHDVLYDQLAQSLAQELPVFLEDGGMIASGYAAELDELRLIRDESKRLIANLQAKYSKETGIGNLKIKHNNILGYFIEVTALQADKLKGQFNHRQTLANNVRFTTTELNELESKINKAREQALAIEFEIIEGLITAIQKEAHQIAQAAQAVAEIDIFTSLAYLAILQNYRRPLIDDSLEFKILKGRHPIVEKALIEMKEQPFVPNDCSLSPDTKIWLLTGPNMAGKSTFLRQNALIAIMAQIGSFVPAESAHIGVIDRISSRIGAGDDLARGRSTFMVEMIETSAILNQATPRSLVILDEIGRGTATFDGLSIAWAVIEYLHNVNQCRTLFATHYHELTLLSETLSNLACYTMRVKEWGGEVIFMHEIIEGAADRSYGIHVAKIAGLPQVVVQRSQDILNLLEKGKENEDLPSSLIDLPLFKMALRKAQKGSIQQQPEIEVYLRSISLEEITPLKALDILATLVEKVKPKSAA